ncbi:hypothetical protein JOD54_000566 [Actinokineospora baliensis]|uniref:DUF4082 domain-containing protein n=1 Tax=Actinokineospora baliensis TaxID=547056 RepID=UPI00195AD3F7|nr:DUF4082 domain-containing protein [Actinokineospora baliensis]MBM7770362.1 hypothetical protein [Actinokineospora baliensis]
MLRRLISILSALLLLPTISPGIAHAIPGAIITTPSDTGVIAPNVPITFAGHVNRTLWDNITAVDLSFDGGKTWQVAPGTQEWAIVYTPTAPGILTVLTRVRDDTTTFRPLTRHFTVGDRPVGFVSCSPCEFKQPNLGPSTAFLRTDSDPRPVELGLRFQVDRPGAITGIKVTHYAIGPGTPHARLWTADGQLLAEAKSDNFTYTFPAPVWITPGATYIASFFTPWGQYAVTENHHRGAIIQPPFTAPPEAGVYYYADEGPEPETGGFPTKTYKSSYYWISPVFLPAR